MNDRERALRDDPRGEFCSVCKEPNYFCDDVGWWYQVLPGSPKDLHGPEFEAVYLPRCQACYTMPPGDR